MAEEATPPRPSTVDFQRDIRPIFVEKCMQCHGPEKRKGGLLLTNRKDALQPVDSGKHAIVPGDSAASELVARVSGALGPCYTISTACSSGAKALASARALIELGLCDAVLAGAIDSACALTELGFSSLQAVSAQLTNPMSRNRDGLTLGEGGAIFLVTRARGGIQLLGAGESSDAYHMSAPEPSGAAGKWIGQQLDDRKVS